MTTPDFSRLGVPAPLVAVLAREGITEPFPIQTATIPDALAGRDVSGRAPTGSGKTLAFGLALMATVDQAAPRRPAALVLAPTRELAEQIKGELVPLGKAMRRYVLAVYGGVGYGHQESSLRRGTDVLVATPGRLEDLIERGSVDLGSVTTVVLDEADRMADMGFLPAVRRILDQTAPDRQTLLFSATLDGDVAALVRDYQRDPVRHEAGSVDSADGASAARHHFWLVEHPERVGHTAEVVNAAGQTIVFTRTRHGADRLAKQLGREGVAAVALHGGRSQSQRNRAIKAFASGGAPALVATDVAARGIHVDDVAAVVHYDPPADHKDYLHRSGRTARAGAGGSVVTLVTRDQQNAVRGLQRNLGMSAPFGRPEPGSLAEGGQRMGDEKPAEKAPTDTDSQGVYVANLPWSTTSDQLADLFAPHGEVLGATIVTDRRTGRSRGFGFVDMAPADATTAITALRGSQIGGRPLTVRAARPRR